MELLGILLVATLYELSFFMKSLVGFLVTSALGVGNIGLVPINVVVTTVFQTSVETYGKTIAIIVFELGFAE